MEQGKEELMKRGDFVWIKRGEARKQAMIVLSSDNEKSLMVMFDGMFCGYVSTMSLLNQDGVYRDLSEGKPVWVMEIGEGDSTWEDAT